jgi:uncharacterized membrane protein
MLMRSTVRSFSHRPRGTVAALLTLVAPALLGVAAVGLDGGLLLVQRRQAQSIADAAALAGAQALHNGSNFSVARTAAIAIGAQGGVTISPSQVTEPKPGYISVSVTCSQPRLVSALWGSGRMSVTATSVARGVSTTAPCSNCADIVRHPTASGSPSLSSSAESSTATRSSAPSESK